MKIIICDDQAVYREDILERCKKFLTGQDIVYSSFSSGEELLASSEAFDFLFLDIEMTGMDGIQVKERLEQNGHSGKIIFLTSHEERMIEAFGANVIGFLRKPVQDMDLAAIIQKIKMFSDKNKVEWQENDRLYAVYPEEIQYIEVVDKYTYMKIKTDRYCFRRSLKDWEELLPESEFVKVNRSCMIHLSLLDGMKNEIVLENGEKIAISRKFRKELKEKYITYLRKQMEKM